MGAFTQWFNERTPGLGAVYKKHMTGYYAPRNFNVMYYFGSLALLVLVNQIVTGIFLTMFYTPTAAGAFDSVQYIMRDVHWGWLVRYMHVTGASMFFIVVYLHMFRGLMYGSYKKPRELVWLLGMLIFLALMAEAFMGYVLPWGNMSFWGAKVIITLFSAVPVIGSQLVDWIMGSFVPSDPTLNRFFALHVVALPLVLLLLVVLHLGALHEVGSNNPDGVEIKKHKGPDGHPLDGIPFHPYYTLKDLVGVGVFLIVCAIIIFFEPTVGGFFLEHDNKGFGVLAMALSIIVLFLVPWLDRGKVKSVRYRGVGYKVALTIFAIVFILLAAIGADLTPGWIVSIFGPDADITTIENLFGRTLVVLYFAFFAFLWAYTFFGLEKTKPVPERVTTHD